MGCKDVKQVVRVLTAQEGISQQGLADRLGVLPAALSRTLGKPDHRITADLLPIAQALGCTLEVHFVRSDGSVAAVVPYGQQVQDQADTQDIP